jgi:hypothetical protein
LNDHPVPKLAVEIRGLDILAQRVIATLSTLPPDALEARAALTDLRRAIVETMLERRPEYEAQLDSRSENRWE